MCYLDDFLVSLEDYLTGSSCNSNVIKPHTRKLDDLGEFSFPASTKNWKRVLDVREVVHDGDIIAHACERRNRNSKIEDSIVDLIECSSDWSLNISKCVPIKSHYHIFLVRENAFRLGIHRVLEMGDCFGKSIVEFRRNIQLSSECESEDVSLSGMRLTYLTLVTQRLLDFMDIKNTEDAILEVQFSTKGNAAGSTTKKVVYCGPVLGETGQKNTATREEYLKKRITDMRLMAEHKYGLRVSSQKGWKEICENLGEASTIIELLQNTPSHATTISLKDSSVGSIKGASFIMYNGARMVKLLREFDKRVENKIYPKLPPFEHVNFQLLKESEEWELLYVYILQFPQVIRSCIFDIENGKINPHNIVRLLSNMSNVFSIYYRRIKILMEPRNHLFDILHSRIYLLKALVQIFFNSMYLLGIKPVTQM